MRDATNGAWLLLALALGLRGFYCGGGTVSCGCFDPGLASQASGIYIAGLVCKLWLLWPWPWVASLRGFYCGGWSVSYGCSGPGLGSRASEVFIVGGGSVNCGCSGPGLESLASGFFIVGVCL